MATYKTRKVLIWLFSAVLTLSVAFAAAFSMPKASAEEVTPITLDQANFAMQNGADINVAERDAIRFSAIISNAHYQGLVAQYGGAANVKFGTLVMPKYYVDTYGAPTVENCFGDTPTYVWGEATADGINTHKVIHNTQATPVTVSSDSENGYIRSYVKYDKTGESFEEDLRINLPVKYAAYSYIQVNNGGNSEYKIATVTSGSERSALAVACSAIEDPAQAANETALRAYLNAYEEYYAKENLGARPFSYTKETYVDGVLQGSAEKISAGLLEEVSITPNVPTGYMLSEKDTVLSGKVTLGNATTLKLSYKTLDETTLAPAAGTDFFTFATDERSATYAAANIDANSNFKVTLPSDIGTVKYVKINGKFVDGATNTAAEMLLPKASLEGVTRGDGEMLIETATKIYKTTVCVADISIMTAEELKTIIPALEEVKSSEYVVLGADITNVGDYAGHNANRFYGTLDGKGHKISDITYTQSGLFYRLDGLVKNLILVNVTYNEHNIGAICSYLKSGDIDNVVIQANLNGKNYSGGIARTVENSESNPAKITNSVIIASNVTGTESGALFCSGDTSNAIEITNTYIVKPQDAALAGKVSDFQTNINTLAASLSYDSIGALLDAESNKLITISSIIKKSGLIIPVSTAEELLAMRNDTVENYYYLENDIDLTGVTVATGSATFIGTFDGKGHTVSNMTITGYNGGAAFFKTLSGTVKNVAFVNVFIDANGENSGNHNYSAAVAASLNGGVIDNAYISVDLSDSEVKYSGGVAGSVKGVSKITNTVVVHQTALSLANKGLIVGKALAQVESEPTYSLDLTGTYAIKNATTEYLAGNDGANETLRNSINNTTGVDYLLADFITGVENSTIAVGSVELARKVAYKQIYNVTDFIAMQSKGSGYYMIAKNLDFSGMDLAVKSVNFTGVLDGNGHTISNINITGHVNNIGTGLFRIIDGGTVRNIGLLNVVLQKPAGNDVNYAYAGAIVGQFKSGTIDNVFVSVDISQSKWYSGGIVGQVAGNVKVTNCVVVHNTALKTNGQDGLIVGCGGATNTIDLTGTYAVYSTTNTFLAGSKNADFATAVNANNASVICTQAQLVEKDFSGYNKAIVDNVNALKNA